MQTVVEQMVENPTMEDRILSWFFPEAGRTEELYLVGGAVRDWFLGRTPKDVDFVCANALAVAERIAARRAAALVTFEKKAGEPCHRVVNRGDTEDFIDLSPIRGSGIADDLAMRDFTVNAMALRMGPDGVPGDLVDPMGGRKDLDRKILRMAAPSAFANDPLRMVRAFRFASELGFAVDPETLAAIRWEAPSLERSAAERIRPELLRILDGNPCLPHVRCMAETGLLQVIFPEIRAMMACTQNWFHHKDVWGHTLLVLENLEELLREPEGLFGGAGSRVRENLAVSGRRALLKLAALLHDVGKPAARAVDPETGRITFHGHEKTGACMTTEIAQRLRMPIKERDFLTRLVVEHLHVLTLSDPKVRRATRMRWYRKMGDDVIPAVLLSIADMKSARGPAATDDGRQRHFQWCRETVAGLSGGIQVEIARPLLINGRDLLALGLSPGPRIGEILRAIQDAQDEGLVQDRDEALALAEEILSGNPVYEN